MSNDPNKDTQGGEGSANPTAGGDSAPDRQNQGSTQSGPTFTEGSDPLAGLKKGFGDMLDSMEGKTVSLKVYVGSIIGVVLLMMLARCGG